MCDIAALRQRIDSFLNGLVEAREFSDGRDLDSIRELAIESLTSEFDDACPDQCIRRRVDSFFDGIAIAGSAAQ